MVLQASQQLNVGFMTERKWKDGKMESSAIGAELFLFGRDDVRYFRSRKGFYKITSTDAETSSA